MERDGKDEQLVCCVGSGYIGMRWHTSQAEEWNHTAAGVRATIYRYAREMWNCWKLSQNMRRVWRQKRGLHVLPPCYVTSPLPAALLVYVTCRLMFAVGRLLHWFWEYSVVDIHYGQGSNIILFLTCLLGKQSTSLSVYTVCFTAGCRWETSRGSCFFFDIFIRFISEFTS